MYIFVIQKFEKDYVIFIVRQPGRLRVVAPSYLIHREAAGMKLTSKGRNDSRPFLMPGVDNREAERVDFAS